VINMLNINNYSPSSGRKIKEDGTVVNFAQGFDPTNEMFKVQSMQKKWRDSFPLALPDADKWDVVLGPGMSFDNATPGLLKLNLGTDINSETTITSKEFFTVPVRSMFGVAVPTKQANQEVYLELISIDPITLEPDGLHVAAWKLDNVPAAQTSALYQVGNSGLPRLTSGNSAVNTWATMTILEIELFSDECWFHSRVLDANTGRSNSYVRHQQIPDPNALYKVRIRCVNLGTAPVAANTLQMQYMVVNDYAELTTEITAGRGNVVAGQAIGVSVTSMPTTTVIAAGAVAHDSTTATNPIVIGARASNIMPAAVSATGDVTQLYATMNGALIQRPFSTPEAAWSFACAAPIAVNTDTVLKVAGATGIRNYLVGLQLINISATPTEFVVKDGAIVIFRGYLPANMINAIDLDFECPLRGTAVTALNFACITAGASVYVNSQGFQAP
jgi:hypothetical protein